ncbi:MAG: hypothetical protein MRY83_16335 [Flavobacteriales bacterium]|nr:hypothetical protein [Flavobacteriales bacterium]
MWEEKLKIYDAIVAKCTGIERKGKTVPYTSANGHMFSLLNKDGELGMRYSKDVQKQYFEKYNTSYLMSHGAKMNGYIRIPEEMLEDLDLLAELLEESHKYVLSLDPK